MANPKSSGGNKAKGKGHHNRQSQQHSQQQQQQQQQQQVDPPSQLTPAPVAATGLEPPTATPLASPPSEDTLALAAAVAASIPAAPLARPANPDRRNSTPAVVTPTGNNQSETSAQAENLSTSRTASAAPAAPSSENRRGIFQRLFGWSS
ncbi:AF4/FMR2 family member lilli [Drosophila takahashii]|uniref:AF4/FMR2 family member lilli n=1 Tax=Drosophila takahashii TaxID=29030 RepID=UPI001CF7F23A|nr:protein giant [Drosophila takahashii]